MSKRTEFDLQDALARCNQEPIHIPGVIQSCGHLLGIGQDDFKIRYASEHSGQIFHCETVELFGRALSDLLDENDIHDLRNTLAKSAARTTRRIVGSVQIEGRAYHLCTSPSDACWVLEFEPEHQHGVLQSDHFKNFPFLMEQVHEARTVQDLMDRLVLLLSALTDYERVMVYRFDADWNGEIIAEHIATDLEPYLGLRFPHWDIPTQARDFMTRFPVRYIFDAEADQTKLLAAADDDPPFDISLAQLRGTSPIHLQYLRNMRVRGTMTLSIVIDGRLWGIVSFHGTKPRVPTAEIRQICASLAPVINTKMQALEHEQTIHLHALIDNLHRQFQKDAQPVKALAHEVQVAVDTVKEEFDVDGVAIGVDDEISQAGLELHPSVIEALREKARAAQDGVWHTESLRFELPHLARDLDALSGALCLDRDDGRWICLTRRPRADAIRWAGSPDKDIDTSDGMARLAPRGSFVLYKQIVQDTSIPWLNQDIKLLEGISLSLLAANQRRIILSAIRRQQELVVDELNHRVRNILALVRSISRQARKHNASLESYTSALEQRMKALSTAHDLGAAGSINAMVSMKEIIRLEAAPHLDIEAHRLALTGEDFGLQAEAAPIFALVIHELMTNAAKYGALSDPNGQVMVSIRRQDAEVTINWVELGGPEVREPADRGFGTTLIEQAVPYELGGTSEIVFYPTGLTATLKLPMSIMNQVDKSNAKMAKKAATAIQPKKIGKDESGTVLVVEDNYMIAVDMLANLRALGFEDAELASSPEQAELILKKRTVSIAILDINLGRGGTSVELAQKLDQEGVPYFFVTGYGELAPLPNKMSKRVKLQKPVSLGELETALGDVLIQTKAG